MRVLVVVLLTAYAMSACGHAQYASHDEYGLFNDPCGNFSTEEGLLPGSVDAPEQLRAFGETCSSVAMASADAAYVRMANASTMHLVDASNGLALQETVAAAIEAAARGASDDAVIAQFCAETQSRNPSTAQFCANAGRILTMARRARGGR